MMISMLLVEGSVRAFATRSSRLRDSAVSSVEFKGKFSVISNDPGGRTAALAGPAAGPVALIPRILRSPKGVEHCGSSAQTISSTEISSARAAVALARSDKPQTIRFRYFIGNLTCARDGEESVSAWLRGTSFLPAARFGPSQAHRARARPSLNPTIGSG